MTDMTEQERKMYFDGEYDHEIDIIKKEIYKVFEEKYDYFVRELCVWNKYMSSRKSTICEEQEVAKYFENAIRKYLEPQCKKILENHRINFYVDYEPLEKGNEDNLFKLIFNCDTCHMFNKHGECRRKFKTFEELKKHFLSEGHYKKLNEEIKWSLENSDW